MVLTPVVELEGYDKIEVLPLPMKIFDFVLYAVSKALPWASPEIYHVPGSTIIQSNYITGGLH